MDGVRVQNPKNRKKWSNILKKESSRKKNRSPAYLKTRVFCRMKIRILVNAAKSGWKLRVNHTGWFICISGQSMKERNMTSGTKLKQIITKESAKLKYRCSMWNHTITMFLKMAKKTLKSSTLQRLKCTGQRRSEAN